MRKIIIVVLLFSCFSSFILYSYDRNEYIKAVKMMNNRNFSEAIPILEDLFDSSNDIHIRSALAAAYNNYAAILKQRKNSDCIEYFEKAVKLNPSKNLLRMNYANALYNFGNYNDAIYQLEYSYGKMKGVVRKQSNILLGLSYFKINDFSRSKYYFEEEQDSPDSGFYLGFIEYKLGNIDKAIQIWNDLKNNYPQKAAFYHISSWIKKSKKEGKVEKNFVGDTTSHFMIKSDFDAKNIDMNYILTTFEDAYYDLGRELKIYPKNRLPVVIYDSMKQYQNATNSPKWTGGLWDGTKIKIPASVCRNKKTLKQVIFHEYVHLLLNTKYDRNYKNIPIWVNEGSAEFFSKELINIYPKPLKLKPDSKNVLTSFFDNPAYFRNVITARRSYRIAYFAVKYIVNEMGIDDLLNLIDNFAKRISKPYEKAFQRDSNEFINDFIDYYK